MKTIITKEDVEKAQEAVKFGKSLARNCVIYQAILRATGNDSITIGTCEVFNRATGETINTNAIVQSVTREHSDGWPSFIGTEIEIPEI